MNRKEKKKNDTLEMEQEVVQPENATPEVEDAADEAGQETAGADEENRELIRLQAELQDAQERILRAQADFDNFRRRTRQDKEDLAKYASSKVITGILPVMDNFERAIAVSKEAQDFDSLFKGVEMIFRQMEQVMEQEGVSAMNTVGQPFNPEFHQAIMQVDSDEHEEGIIVEEVMKGYVLKDKVLRPAMVKVSS
jgi:molecular chaperone GrpE